MLAVAGGKGGVGRTTTTLGLAGALAGQRRRPLAVDADARCPNLHVAAGVEAEPGVSRVANGVAVADAACAATMVPGVDLLTAEPDADVHAALVRLDDRQPVLVDCPGGGGRAATVPLQSADAALVVTTADARAVAAARKTAETARAVGTRVAAVVVSRAMTVPDPVATAFDAPATAIPPADGDPLDDGGVRAAHDRLAERLSHDRRWDGRVRRSAVTRCSE
jgi:septum site-determining protein MinD